MQIINNVQGSKESAKELIIGKTTVYIHSNIKDISYTDEHNNYIELYEYDEIQYDKDEYIALMSENQQILESQLTFVELALCDMYEEALNG
jgi:hypothetical protein